MIARRFTIIALMAGIARFGFGQTPTDDKPVARVGTRVITRHEISCELHAPNFAKIAAEQQRDPAIVCLQLEQRRLQLLAANELFDAASRKLGIEPSAEELANDAAFHNYSETEFERLSERYRALARAALSVFHGEGRASVYQREVGPKGFSETEFNRFVDLLATAGAAERFIERHTPDHFRSTITTDARRRIARTRLMQALSREAETRGVSFDTHAEAFWRGLAGEIGLEILDPRYEPISLKELSWQPQTSNTP